MFGLFGGGGGSGGNGELLGGAMGNIPIVGQGFDLANGLLGMGPDPTEAMQRQYQQNLAMLQAYMPRAMQAREMGLGHTLKAYEPANEYLKQMYGNDMGLDLNALSNPGIASYLSDPAIFEAARQAGQPPPNEGVIGGQGPLEKTVGSDLGLQLSGHDPLMFGPIALTDEFLGGLGIF